MTRILLLAGDVLPFPGYPTTGAGLRAWSIGQGLQAAGFEVFFSMPEFHLKETCSKEERELSWHPDDRERPIRLIKPDILLVCHWPAMPSRRLDIPTILDLHGPHLMERKFWDESQAAKGVREKISAFSRADFFVCAGERQRYYFFNWLLLAGFPMESRLMTVVPVSLSPELPARTAPVLTDDREVTIVYGGMFLPWQDPVRPMEALLDALTACDRGRLHVFGGPHPIVRDSSGRFDRLVTRLREHPRVSIESPRPHDELISFYCGADLAFDLMEPNCERELAYTTRTVEYLWCGLPVIHGDYAELSPLIEQAEAGWIVDFADETSLRETFSAILLDSSEIRRRSFNAQELVRKSLNWNSTMAPLLDYCRNPRRTIPGKSLLDELPHQPTISSAPRSFPRRILNRLSRLLSS